MIKYILLVLALFFSGTIFGQDGGLPVGKVYKKPETTQPAVQVKPAIKSKVVSYTEAYNESIKKDQPLMVIMTASWCGPCQVLKNKVIPSMFMKDKLNDVSVAFIDIDGEAELATKMRSSSSVPEIILFKKRAGKWSRKQVFGLQSEESLEKLIGE